MKNMLFYDSHPISLKGGISLLGTLENIHIQATNDLDEFKALSANQNLDLILFAINNPADLHILNRNDLRRTPWIVNVNNPVYDGGTLKMLSCGVKGCVSKTSSNQDLLSCIETVLSGNVFLCPASVQLLAAECLLRSTNGKNASAISSETVKKNEMAVRSLSPRQKEVAILLSKGMKTSEIGNKLNLHNSTISTVKGLIFKKMQVRNIFELAAHLA